MLNKQKIHLRIETIIMVSLKQKNENCYAFFCRKLCKRLRGLQARKRAYTVIIPVEDGSFDEIIFEKVPTLNGMKLPKTKEQ